MAVAIPTPSPVRHVPELSGHAPIWVKNDGELIATWTRLEQPGAATDSLQHADPLLKPEAGSGQLYGGNKVRKLARLLPDALARGARRVLTVGAAGSHHALSTALLARAHGLECVLFLLPQAHTEHAEQMLRENLSHATRSICVPHASGLPLAIAKVFRPGDYWIPPGGSNQLGASAFAEAALELETQVDRGELPEPEFIIVALGSGGTAGGLTAGLEATRLRSRVIAVDVGGGTLGALWARRLASQILRSLGLSAAPVDDRLQVVDQGFGNYGVPHPAGHEAADRALRVGFKTEPVYTAKAFAFALARSHAKTARGPVLFWHTFSACPAPAHGRISPLVEDLDAADLEFARARKLLLRAIQEHQT